MQIQLLQRKALVNTALVQLKDSRPQAHASPR